MISEYIRGLSDAGKLYVMEQLIERMKHDCDLDEQGCYDTVIARVTQDVDFLLHCELSRCETESGHSEVIEFEESHFLWDDIDE
ncbi:MAG: hypothetical protein GY931_00465 [Maribacter sp.]|nr:hypothetical protein [Maribacter sp.]